MSSRCSSPRHILVALLMVAGLCFVTRPAQSQESLVFEVSPRRICTGEAVEVLWAEAEDRGVLITEPAIDGAGAVAQEGSLKPTLRDSTLFRMYAISDGDTTRALQEVAVFNDGQEKRLAFSLEAEGDTALFGGAELRRGVWSPNVRIGSLFSPSGRPVHVLHRGNTAILGKDDTSVDAFYGLPFTGMWRVRTPILPGETLGQPEQAPPTRLYLTATVLCSQ